MHAIYDERDDAVEIAAAGIEAGATFDTGSALPMTHYTLEIG